MADKKKKLGQYIRPDNDEDVFSLEDRSVTTDLPRVKNEHPLDKGRGMLEKTKMKPGDSKLTPPADDDSVMFDDRKKPSREGLYIVQRNGLDDAKWNQFVKDSQENPDYHSTYKQGKEVDYGYYNPKMINQEKGSDGVRAPDDDDSIAFINDKDGAFIVKRNGTSQKKWSKLVEDSKKDPDYVSTYEKGEQVHTIAQSPLNDEANDWEAAKAKHDLRVEESQRQARPGKSVQKVGAGAEVMPEEGGSGPAAFFRRAVGGASKGAIPQNADTGYAQSPASAGVSLGDAAKAAGKGFIDAAIPTVPVAETLMSPKLGPTVQNLGAAAGGMAKSGLGAVGEGLADVGAPRIGAAVQGVAGAIQPQPNLSGLPPVMRPGAQEAVNQANGTIPGEGLPQMKGGAVPPPMPIDESSSLSVKMKGPMGGPASMPVQAQVDPALRLNQSFDELEKANAEANTAQLQHDKETDVLKREQITRMERFEADRLEKENFLKDTVSRAKMAHDSVMLQMERPIARVDPGRFWSDASAGSKALMMLSSVFAGLAGKGGEFLARMDNMVEQDVRAQQMDIENKSKQLSAREGATQSAYAMAREAGLDQRASLATAKDALYKSMQLQLQAQIEAIPDPVKRAQLMQANMQIEMSRQKVKGELTNALSEETLRKAQAYGIYQHARNEAAEVEVKRAKAQKGIKEDKMPPGEQAKISGAEQGLKLLPALKQAVGSGNWGDALIDEVAKRLPGTNAAARNSEAQFLGRTIFSNLDRSVVMAADQKFLDKLVSGVGFGSLSQGDLAAFGRILRAQRNATINTADQLGQQTGELQPDVEGVPGEHAR